MRSFLLFASILVFSVSSSAKVLQEGWFKLLLGTQHAGYAVQKYSFDDAKKEFHVTTFTKTNALGGNFTESLTAKSTSGFDPISYQYTMTVGKKTKLIDAAFKNGSMTAKITEDGQTKTIEDKLAKGTFLSSFLVYMILNNKTGMKVGNSFEYNAIAEEDAKSYKGFADVSGTETVNGHETFKVLVKYKDTQYINHVTPIGEMYDVKQPASAVQLVAATKEEATRGFTSSDKLIKNLFGGLPQNSSLAIAKAASASPAEAADKTKTSSAKANAIEQPQDLPAKTE